MTPQERQEIFEVCDSERFCDVSPREIYATLLDEGVYLASIPTFYLNSGRQRSGQRT
ncbi:hypothetical protein [Acidithrix ferrooxidans]|uniref:hypothetical protein n=1 Tax=Acidithrix ferrooxidans TaxID=1280514 RepID=UPI000B1609A5|nr:hypothetical protein [Acidithrix ferrooxidans]